MKKDLSYDEIVRIISDFQTRQIKRNIEISDAVYRKLHPVQQIIPPPKPITQRDFIQLLRQFPLQNRKLFRSRRRMRLFRKLASLQWITASEIRNHIKYHRPRAGIDSLRKIFRNLQLPFLIIYKRTLGYKLAFSSK
jgi:hypothetical protein